LENAIPVADWPPFSPDLNPIEHIWVHLKRMVMKMHPEIEFMTGGKEVVAEALGKALQEAWRALPKELFDSLIESMEERVKACIQSKGWHTKY
jgi:transposase